MQMCTPPQALSHLVHERDLDAPPAVPLRRGAHLLHAGRRRPGRAERREPRRRPALRHEAQEEAEDARGGHQLHSHRRHLPTDAPQGVVEVRMVIAGAGGP